VAAKAANTSATAARISSWIQDGVSRLIEDVPDGQRKPQRATARGRALRFLQPPRQDVQLRLRHGALQTEEQPIIEIAQVVNAIRVHD
jgi:hypothetical protein